MKYLSLFSGIGGFELGIQQAYESNNEHAHISAESESQERSQGWVGATNKHKVQLHNRNRTAALCVGYSEIDKYATQVYQKHFPEHKNYGDITKIKAEELPDFDFLCGGFPCQSFSIAGKRGGFNDTRGTLFFDIARILGAKRPSLFLLENVKGLLSHDGGRTFSTIVATIDELGYDCQWQVLNSKNFGVPQNRERVFIIGHLRGTSRPEVFPFGEDDNIPDNENGTDERRTQAKLSGTVRGGNIKADGTFIKVAGSLSNEKWDKFNESSRRVYDTEGIAPTVPTVAGGGHTPKILQKSPNWREDGSLREFEKVSPTLRANMGDNHPMVSEGLKIRRLTPIECMRLQGFPDNWCDGISDTQKYKCAGNAVTVNVIQAIMERLL